MRKVQCPNHHFYNAEKYSVCPICGSADLLPAQDEPAQPEKKKGLFFSSQQRPSRQPEQAAPPTLPLYGGTSVSTLTGEPGGGAPAQKTVGMFDAQAPDEPAAPAAPLPEPDVPAPPDKPATLRQLVENTGAAQISPLSKTVAYFEAEAAVPPVGWLIGIAGLYWGREFPCRTGNNRIGRSADMDIVLSDDPSVSRELHAMLLYEPHKRAFFLQSGTGNGLIYLNGELVLQPRRLAARDRVEIGKSTFLFFPLCGEDFCWEDFQQKT